MIHFINEEETCLFAKHLASCLKAPLVLTFSGDIGAGKTTLIRAMLRALGVDSAIKSPTFSLVETYSIENLQIHHFDLYRILDEEELEYIGFREYFKPDSLCCIEWPERVANLDCVDINFTLKNDGDGRVIFMKAFSPTGEHIVSCLKGKYEAN